MSTWRNFELGARVRKLGGGGEERLALDRRSGKPITLRVYPRPQPGASLPELVRGQTQHLAQPLELIREQGEALVIRELAFGPSLEDLLALGPQPEAVVSSLLRQLLEGLSAWHAAGRTHLRLSPAAVRFDLLAGLLKVTDLEQALLELEPPSDLIPRYLEPEARGAGRPGNDVYSVGRIGEALLRGSAPLGPWGGSGGSPGQLWDFVQRCQSPSLTDRPRDATEALAELERLGLSQAPALTLPLGSFVRGHVLALRELRRWRAQPLPPSRPQASGAFYRELLSSHQATRLWGAVGVGALIFTAGALALAEGPSRRGPLLSSFPSETCEADARPIALESAASTPEGLAAVAVEVAEGENVAVDGCPLPGLGGPQRIAVSRGLHWFRASEGATTAVKSLEVRDGDRVALHPGEAPEDGTPDAVAALVHRLQQGAAPSEELDPFDPVEMGMLDPFSRQLLQADRVVFGGHSELDAALPMSLGLTLDGLRAARRRFDDAGVVCAASLANAASQQLGAGTSDSDRPLQLAAEFLTVTRIRGPQLSEPLRTEREGLARLGIEPSRRLLSVVELLAAQPEVDKCLTSLVPKAHEVDELSALALGQLPGVRASDEPPDGDDSSE